MSPNTLGEYIQNKHYKKETGDEITHTKIGSKEFNITGGSYTINNNDEFLNHYFKQLKLGGNFYFTEKQLDSDNRMLVVDLDFKFKPEIKTRQHNEETIKDIIDLYAEKINEIYHFESNSKIIAFVMEKPNVNCLEDKTKDGIHIIFDFKMKTEEQMLLRKKMINDIKLDLPLTNSFDDIFDEGISKGCINWQLYGSKKPNHEAYKLTYTYDIRFNTDMEDYEVKNNNTFDIENDYEKLSVRYDNHKRFKVRDSEFLLEALKKEKEALQPKEKKMIVETPKDETTMNYNEKIINLIKPETLGKFEDWKKIIFAMKNEGFSEEFARSTSNRGIGDFTPLTEEAWEKIWNAQTDQLTMGTLKFYAKRDSPEEYEELKFKIFEPDENESFVKDINSATDSYFSGLYAFLKPNNTLYIKDDDAYYTWIENTWVKESKDGASYIRTDIEKTLKTYQTNLIFKYLQKKDEALNQLDIKSKGKKSFKDSQEKDMEIEIDRIKIKYEKILSSLQNRIQLIETTCRKNNIWTELKSIYLRESLKHNIKFDMNPDVIGFNNKKYNFKTKEFQPIQIDDYISMTCGYDYKEPEEDEMETIKDIITKAFPNEERRKCYVSIMYNCLIGGAKDKFVVANGTGGNSKGVINELLRETLGEYAVEMGTSVLTEKPKTGANPELAKLDKKRLILSKEPNENDRIRCDMLKKVCGNSKITDARECYSNKTEIVLCGTNIMEVNVKLGFDGKLQDDIGRRLMDILFESTFTDEAEILNDPTRKNVYKKNQFFTTEEFKNKHRCALFKYLIENAETKIYNPECVQNDTKKYMEDNDNVYNWVKENYEMTTNKEDVVRIKDMYEEYKKSDEYQNAYKKDRKTLKTFSVEIITHKRLKSKYVEKLQDKFIQTKYDSQCMRNVLIGVIKHEEKSIKKEEDQICYIKG